MSILESVPTPVKIAFGVGVIGLSTGCDAKADTETASTAAVTTEHTPQTQTIVADIRLPSGTVETLEYQWGYYGDNEAYVWLLIQAAVQNHAEQMAVLPSPISIAVADERFGEPGVSAVEAAESFADSVQFTAESIERYRFQIEAAHRGILNFIKDTPLTQEFRDALGSGLFLTLNLNDSCGLHTSQNQLMGILEKDGVLYTITGAIVDGHMAPALTGINPVNVNIIPENIPDIGSYNYTCEVYSTDAQGNFTVITRYPGPGGCYDTPGEVPDETFKAFYESFYQKYAILAAACNPDGTLLQSSETSIPIPSKDTSNNKVERTKKPTIGGAGSMLTQLLEWMKYHVLLLGEMERTRGQISTERFSHMQHTQDLLYTLAAQAIVFSKEQAPSVREASHPHNRSAVRTRVRRIQGK